MSKRILRLPTVKELTGLSRSTIYRQISEGSFPQAIPLGGRAVGWIEEEIAGWVDKKIATARGLVAESSTVEK